MKCSVVLVTALVLSALPVALFGQSLSPLPPFPSAGQLNEGPYVQAEVGRIEADLAGRKIGDIEVQQLLSLRDRLSVAAQKDAYVRTIGLHSFLLPGLGQLETGDTAGGIGFMAADLGVLTGTFIVAYSLLPADLRFDRIDYFNNSVSSISSSWTNHTFTEYLPAFGAFMAGMIVDQTLRHWSAAIGRRQAAKAIDENRVTFTPRLGPGFMGFGIAW